MDPTTVATLASLSFKALDVLSRTIKNYSRRKINNKVALLRFLREARENMKMLKDDFLIKDPSIIGIIDCLENEANKTLINEIDYERFNIKKVKHKKISIELFTNNSKYKTVSNFEFYDYIEVINNKIKALKKLPRMYPELKSKKIRPSARLIYLLKMYIYLFDYLDTSKK